MAGRKSTKKDARDGRGAASETSASGDEMGRAFTVVVERMESNFKVFGEALTGLTEKVDGLNDKVDRGFAQNDRRFSAIEARLDAMDARFDAMDARFDAMDARFDGVDRDLALVKDAITVHDRDLRGIRGKR